MRNPTPRTTGSETRTAATAHFSTASDGSTRAACKVDNLREYHQPGSRDAQKPDDPDLGLSPDNFEALLLNRTVISQSPAAQDEVRQDAECGQILADVASIACELEASLFPKRRPEGSSAAHHEPVKQSVISTTSKRKRASKLAKSRACRKRTRLPVPWPSVETSLIDESPPAADTNAAPDSTTQQSSSKAPKYTEKGKASGKLKNISIKIKKWKRTRPKKQPQAENVANPFAKISDSKEPDSVALQMGSSIRQLYIILWKDVYINQIRRHVVWTLLELAFAVIAMYGIGKDSLEQRFGDPVPEEAFARVQPLQLWEHTATKILYTPDVELLAKVIRKVREDLSIESAEAVATPGELDDRVERGFEHYGSVVGGRLRGRPQRRAQLAGPDAVPRPHARPRVRHTPAILEGSGDSRPAERLLDERDERLAAPALQRFPYPAFYPEGFSSTYSRMVFHFGVGFLLPFASVVAKITDEKCSGMRELLSIAGTSELVYWGSHFLSASFTTLLLSCVCMLFLFVFGTEPALSYSDPLLIFVVLITFNSLTILHAMFVSVPAHQHIAFPYLMLQNPLGRGYYLRSRASKIITSMSPGMGLHWAFMVIERFERFRGGVNWSNMNDSASTLDNVSLSDLLMVNVCTCFLMIFLIWYMDNIIPWGPGIHKPPWFPLLKSYWMPQPTKNVKSGPNPDPTLFETDPQHLIPAIQVTSLKKFYRNFLLQNINLKIFRHQITVLLGPCGSGKSTMIKMVTGLVHPSSGQIIVDNYDVVLHTEEARERIAYCPADNVLFDELTVEEHLLFFGMLKGLRTSKIRPEINLLLTDIQKSEYMSYRPSTLSDGMKRLLCVAITLLVASKCKIMIFDEPTATMDPHSQREVWELLLKARRHCCILLTTQNMHEADVLADKIGIMNKGLLWCSGSPGFLRERFRAGYNIRIMKEPGCDAAAIEALFKRYIPERGRQAGHELRGAVRDRGQPGQPTPDGHVQGAGPRPRKPQDRRHERGHVIPRGRFGQETKGSLAQVRWVVPVCVLLLATYFQHLFTEDKIVSSDFYKDRFFYSVRTLHVPAVGFVTANGSTDPVVRHLMEIFAEEDVHLVDVSAEHTNSRLLDYAYDNPRAYNYLLLFGAVLKENTAVLVQSKLFFAGLPLSADALLIEVLMGIFTPLALCFHAASFVVYPIAERCSKFKHLQMMTGVSGAVYWLSNFIFDTLLAASCAVIFVPTIFYSHRYTQKAEYIAMLALLFVAHSLSMVPFCYLASTLFRDSSFALSIMVIFFFFIGLLGALETVIIHFTHTVAEARLLSLVPQAMDILLRSVPTFTLTRGISQLQRLQRENEICLSSEEVLAIACKNVVLGRTVSLKYCCSVLTSRNGNDTMDETRKAMVEPYELSGAVMIEVFVMLAEAVVLFAFVAIMDAAAYARIRRKLLARECQEGPRLSKCPLDSDVGHEAAIVQKLGSGPMPPEYALVVSKLTKSFGLCNGVDNVSFILKTGQCLGIIGVTGAGKTELMQLLTGLSEISSGDAYIGSLSLSRTPTEYTSKIGYCPDALGLPDHLTGREIIELFCVLRGYRQDDTAAMVNNLLRVMELSTVANEITSNYTPGDKRKLCIALAIAGLPRVILLDEPSTGVDMAAKAQIRRSLSIVRERTDCAMLVTSNSMQQCEVLCDRIAIMLSGQLECIGTVDELKSKFGRGYTITIRLRQDTFDDSEYQEDLTQDMKAEFHGCQLDHSFQGVLEYRIATTYTTWSEMFSKMAVIRKKYRFKEFYVCDTTLEQIFVSYARKQINFSKAMALASTP
ncbi:hypothetical protein MTO96_019608 [Rhipicephalus appendiculatus]